MNILQAISFSVPYVVPRQVRGLHVEIFRIEKAIVVNERWKKRLSTVSDTERIRY
jgi:hypothetical protein